MDTPVFRRSHILKHLGRVVLIILAAAALAGCWWQPEPASIPTPSPSPDIIAVHQEAMRPSEVGGLASLTGLSRYRLSLTVDMEKLTFEGRESLHYVNPETISLPELYFRLFPNAPAQFSGGFLTVTQVLVNGRPTEASFQLGDTALRIPLRPPLPPGSRAQIDMDFQGRVPLAFGENPASTNYGIFNYVQGSMTLAGWFPILAVYDDRGWNVEPVVPEGDAVYSDAALYEVSVRAPSGMALIASGSEVSTIRTPDGQSTSTFVSGPMRDFIVILGELKRASRQVGETIVNSYYRPGHEQGGRYALDFAAQALKLFDERFGPYPYAELDVVEVPLQLFAGVEYPGVVLIASDFYEQPEREAFTLEDVVAHEVAHQWWYGVVGNDVLGEPWLDEGLTTHSTAFYFEALYGKETYRQFKDYWKRNYRRLVEIGQDAPVAQPVSAFKSSAQYSVLVYLKGALFFDALREQVGDETFFQILRRYYQANKYGIATAQSFLSIAQEVSGQEMEALYRDWLLTTGKGL